MSEGKVEQVSAEYAARAVLAEQERTAAALSLAQDRQIEINIWRGRLEDAESSLTELREALERLTTATEEYVQVLDLHGTDRWSRALIERTVAARAALTDSQEAKL